MHYWFDVQVGRVEQDIEALADKFRNLNVKVHGAMTQAEWVQLIDRMNQCSDSLVRLGKEIHETASGELAGE